MREAHRVLLVEDQSIVAEWARPILMPHATELVVCNEPQSAMKTALAASPTLILQDLVMPQMHGFALLERYRESPQLCDVPVIVLSSIADADEKVRAFELGAADYLVKLPHPVELLARVLATSRAYLTRKERDLLNSQLHKTMEQLTESNSRLARVAREDGLTGLANRRAFDEALESEWRRCMREQKPLSLALIDLDFFKLYNDHYGYVRGDECLRTVATAVSKRARRPADLAARYGGEELCVLLPYTSREGSRAVAEALRRSIEALDLPHASRRDGVERVTASIGVTTHTPLQGASPEALIESAETALHQAKAQGRNVVVHATIEPYSTR
jgi:two-component system, chemotaxis family, response regulator WspR